MQALLLDHDDVLVMSEALVFEASCSLINEILLQKGVSNQYSPLDLRAKFAGLGFTGIMRLLALQHGFAIDAEELQQLVPQELELVVQLLEVKAESSPGAVEMLTQVRDWGITCAIVSSSELRRIKTCLRRTGLDLHIPHENLFSAADSVREAKPSPAIYNLAVQTLGIAPEQCLAVEDSTPGIMAAVQAKIEVVGYVGAQESSQRRAEHSTELLAAGASATFSDWSTFLTWLGARLSAIQP